MRTKTVTRYYCDHCGRGGFKKPSMARHEGVCFSNPNRTCPECEDWGDVAENIKVLEEKGLDALKDHVKGCPACTMSAVIQSNKRGLSHQEAYVRYDDYKEDIDDYRNEKYREESINCGLSHPDS